jgi:hypothetical protein
MASPSGFINCPLPLFVEIDGSGCFFGGSNLSNPATHAFRCSMLPKLDSSSLGTDSFPPTISNALEGDAAVKDG